jgi:septum formation protein
VGEPLPDPPVAAGPRAAGSGPAGGPAAQPLLVLASGSPRRRELLQRLGLAPVVRPADLDESPRPGESADELVLRLAVSKAAAVAAAAPAGVDEVVLAADTEVVLDGRALGKPVDREEAAAMLTALAGRTHEVMTGLAVRRGTRIVTDRVVTTVTIRALTPDEIAWYLSTGEPEGKSGAYALQGAGAVLVDRVEGSDTNVIGLPLPAAVALLRQVGVEPFGASARATH